MGTSTSGAGGEPLPCYLRYPLRPIKKRLGAVVWLPPSGLGSWGVGLRACETGCQNPGMQILEFNSPETVSGWHPIDDRVMGGVSTSRFTFHPDGYATFEGVVRSENGGGFASVRHSGISLGDKLTEAFRLEVRGDGRTYKLNLRMDGDFDGVNYQAPFCPPAGRWVQVLIPTGQFTARLRGRAVRNAPPLRLEMVRQMGWMVGDGQLGEFALNIRSIRCLGGNCSS